MLAALTAPGIAMMGAIASLALSRNGITTLLGIGNLIVAVVGFATG